MSSDATLMYAPRFDSDPLSKHEDLEKIQNWYKAGTTCPCGVAGCPGASLEDWNKYHQAMLEWMKSQPACPKECATTKRQDPVL